MKKTEYLTYSFAELLKPMPELKSFEKELPYLPKIANDIISDWADNNFLMFHHSQISDKNVITFFFSRRPKKK